MTDLQLFGLAVLVSSLVMGVCIIVTDIIDRHK